MPQHQIIKTWLHTPSKDAWGLLRDAFRIKKENNFRHLSKNQNTPPSLQHFWQSSILTKNLGNYPPPSLCQFGQNFDFSECLLYCSSINPWWLWTNGFNKAISNSRKPRFQKLSDIFRILRFIMTPKYGQTQLKMGKVWLFFVFLTFFHNFDKLTWPPPSPCFCQKFN